MSEISGFNVKTRILHILYDLDEEEIDEIDQWISSRLYKKDLEKLRNVKKSEVILKKIGQSIKKIIPLEAEFPTENINMPTVGEGADFTKVNTCHIDGFLFDECDIEELEKEGKLQRRYCLDCHSRNVKDLIFISHSVSRMTVQYIFKVLLPNDLSEKQILDVGSRLGTILYGAYYLSNIGNIVGVEVNKECCDVQESIIEQFSIDKNRVKIIYSDIMQCQDIVISSDIIFVNVLDFFVDQQKHKNIWYFLKKYIRTGTYLVTTKSLVETLESLNIYDELINWFKICKPCQMENEFLFDMEDLDCELFLYTICM